MKVKIIHCKKCGSAATVRAEKSMEVNVTSVKIATASFNLIARKARLKKQRDSLYYFIYAGCR